MGLTKKDTPMQVMAGGILLWEVALLEVFDHMKGADLWFRTAEQADERSVSVMPQPAVHYGGGRMETGCMSIPIRSTAGEHTPQTSVFSRLDWIPTGGSRNVSADIRHPKRERVVQTGLPKNRPEGSTGVKGA